MGARGADPFRALLGNELIWGRETMSTSSVSVSFYSPFTLSFNVGSQTVDLYGALQVSGSSVAVKLGKDLDADIVSDVSSGSYTTELTAPFGMNGVVLKDFGMSGEVYKDAKGNTVLDFEMSATATFCALSLTAAIVVEDSDTRLAILTLSSSPPLTLTEFLESIIKYGSSVTDEFAFTGGYLYYLNPPDGSLDSYRYSYELPSGSAISCESGLNLTGNFQMFDKYDLTVSLSVSNILGVKKYTLSAKSTDTWDFDFVDVIEPSLSIEGDSTGKITIELSATIAILSWDLKTTLSYSTTNKQFEGTLKADLGKVSMRSSSGTKSESVDLSIGYTWSKSTGFALSDISGLPSTDLDFVDKYVSILNDARSHGCDKMLSDWFSTLTQTKLTPALNGSPSKSDGKMVLPLKLTYAVMASGTQIASSTIEFTAKFSIPSSLSNLPAALWDSVWDSLEDIATDILSDEDTYEAILAEVIRKGGAKAGARALCRAIDEGLNDVAKSLAKVAGELVVDTLADAVLLAGYMIAAALLGVKAITAFFEKIWDTIKSWFKGDDDSKKDEARKELATLRSEVEATIADVDSLVSTVKEKIKIGTLTTSLNSSGQPVASLTWALGAKMTLEKGTSLSCELDILSGTAGDETGTVLSTVKVDSFPVTYSWPELSWPGYQMNARVCSVLTGYTFLTATAKSALTDAISKLGEIDDASATSFKDYLQGKLDTYTAYNSNGVKSDLVYASSGVPSQMTVGQSYIGLNTRISQ